MRRNSSIFIALFVFFIAVAMGALFLLSGRGSVFNRDTDSIGAQTAVMSENVVGEEATEEVSAASVISVPEPAAAEATVEEAAAEESVKEEAAAEATVEEASQEETVPEKKYYKFVTNTEQYVLRVRQEPSEDSTIVGNLKKGTPGYVLVPGNKWCKVIGADTVEGYCATEYLLLTEVTEEDYPEKYRSLVEAPSEEFTEGVFAAD